MKLVLHLSDFGWPVEAAQLAPLMADVPALAEDGGFDGIAVGAGLGLPFPPVGVRYDLVEDALELSLRMWSGDHGDDEPYTGHHIRAARPLNLPQSLQRPHPPILIAGDGERRTLPLVARFADACSLVPSPEIPRKLDVLRRHCEEAGTDFDRIERTCAYAFDVDDGGPGPAS